MSEIINNVPKLKRTRNDWARIRQQMIDIDVYSDANPVGVKVRGSVPTIRRQIMRAFGESDADKKPCYKCFKVRIDPNDKGVCYILKKQKLPRSVRGDKIDF